MPRRHLTLDEVELLRAKAVRFLHHVADDPDKAEEFEAMSPQEYADHKAIEIVESNPTVLTLRVGGSSIVTREELESRIAELEEENEDLQSRLDSVLDIVQPVEQAQDQDGDETGEEENDYSDELYESA